MPNENSHTPILIPIATAVLSALSLIGVAILNNRSNVIQGKIGELNAMSKTQEVALERSKFEDEQKERRDKTVSENIPKLLGSVDSDRRAAVAILFSLYPNDAKQILETVNKAQNEEGAKNLSPAIAKAEVLSKATGDWIIVIGSDNSLEAAKPEAQKAKAQGFNPTIYHRGNWFATTVGKFQTEVDANSINIAVRSSIGRDSLVFNLNAWCPQANNRGDYVDCQ